MPQYIAHGFSWDALLPYYSLQGLPDVVGYILSAVIADVLRSFAGAGKTVLFSTTTTSLSGSSPASSTYTPPTKRGTRWPQPLRDSPPGLQLRMACGLRSFWLVGWLVLAYGFRCLLYVSSHQQ